MDSQMVQALKESIEKWEQRASGVYEGLDGSGSCPLCIETFKRNDLQQTKLRCLGCPVYEKTKQTYCGGTPYDEYVDTDSRSSEEREAAQKEVDFLKSLLPVL